MRNQICLTFLRRVSYHLVIKNNHLLKMPCFFLKIVIMKSEARKGVAMKIRIELDTDMAETEVVIRTAQYGEEVARIQAALEQANRQPIAFYKDTSEYFVDLKNILFLKRMLPKFMLIAGMMLMKSN